MSVYLYLRDGNAVLVSLWQYSYSKLRKISDLKLTKNGHFLRYQENKSVLAGL